MTKVQVLDAIEEIHTPGVFLFGGVVLDTDTKVTFHLRGEAAQRMADLVSAGQSVVADIPTDLEA